VLKKQQIEGATFTLSLSPLQAIRDFFNTEAREIAPISRFSGAYRTYKKRVVEEGHLTEWGAVTSGAEKGRMGISRIGERRGKTGW